MFCGIRPAAESALRESLIRLPELAATLTPCRAPLLVEIVGALTIAPEPLELLQHAVAAEHKRIERVADRLQGRHIG